MCSEERGLLNIAAVADVIGLAGGADFAILAGGRALAIPPPYREFIARIEAL
jgi:hypothetical protein